MRLEKALKLIEDEVITASDNHRRFRSPHEGYAIIKEELDELWEAIRRVKSFDDRNEAMKREAIQLGAMATRFLMDLV